MIKYPPLLSVDQLESSRLICMDRSNGFESNSIRLSEIVHCLSEKTLTSSCSDSVGDSSLSENDLVVSMGNG